MSAEAPHNSLTIRRICRRCVCVCARMFGAIHTAKPRVSSKTIPHPPSSRRKSANINFRVKYEIFSMVNSKRFKFISFVERQKFRRLQMMMMTLHDRKTNSLWLEKPFLMRNNWQLFALGIEVFNLRRYFWCFPGERCLPSGRLKVEKLLVKNET